MMWQHTINHCFWLGNDFLEYITTKKCISIAKIITLGKKVDLNIHTIILMYSQRYFLVEEIPSKQILSKWKCNEGIILLGEYSVHVPWPDSCWWEIPGVPNEERGRYDRQKSLRACEWGVALGGGWVPRETPTSVRCTPTAFRTPRRFHTAPITVRFSLSLCRPLKSHKSLGWPLGGYPVQQRVLLLHRLPLG